MWAGGAGDVNGFFCRTEALDVQQIEAAVALLSTAERERRVKFGFARDRREYAVAHALLRVVVGAVLGVPAQRVELTADDRGKPLVVLSDSEKWRSTFSLSHCQGIVACVVAPEALVGIDVEAMDTSVDFSRIAAEYFTPAEYEGLEACDGAARVHRFKRGSGLPVKAPVVDMMEIGAGGGSVARGDALGLLKVGPHSAGAVAVPGTPLLSSLGSSTPL